MKVHYILLGFIVLLAGCASTPRVSWSQGVTFSGKTKDFSLTVKPENGYSSLNYSEDNEKRGPAGSALSIGGGLNF